MGCTHIHGYDRNTYYPALALYKIQFEEIRYHKLANNLKIEKQKTCQNDKVVAIERLDIFTLQRRRIK